MSLKWGEEEIEGFSSPVKKAEKTNELGWWVLFVTAVVMGVFVYIKNIR